MSQLNRGDHVFISSILAYVGMDPRKDVEWVPANERSGVPIFVEGKVDAVIGFPPEPHELRLHEVGIINSNPNKLISQGTDRRFLNELKA